MKEQNQMVKEGMNSSKVCIAELQDFMTKLQMARIEKTMEEGKELMATYVKKSQEGMKLLGGAQNPLMSTKLLVSNFA